jgi:metal-sulfur cluster biosynthetic enzyme
VISEHDVRKVLNGIDDPCSVAAGCRAGLADMGLIESVTIDQDSGDLKVRVELGTTEVGCLMVGMFMSEAKARVGAMPGVKTVEVVIAHDAGWTEEKMDPGYREKLRLHRQTRR